MEVFMKTYKSDISWRTTASTDVIDISSKVTEAVPRSGVHNGICLVSVPGSTASITTIEYESGVVEDLKRAVEELIPSNRTYAHDARWGDGNGYSHVRAALFKPSLGIPIIDGELALGTWQQIVLLDFDNKPRNRKINLCIIGT
jgi:secondary thiamine-phosphate synthase enzyme